MKKEHFNNTEAVKYFVSYSEDKSVLHVGEIHKGNLVSTGLDHLDIYDTIEEIVSAHGQEVADKLNQDSEEVVE